MNGKRVIWPSVVFLLFLAVSSAYPLQGSNGVVNCVIFDGHKGFYDINNSLLYLDVGISRGVNATFEVVDQNNNTYPVDLKLSKALQPGRFSLVFMVPRTSTIASLNVIPEGSNPFAIMWDKPIKYTNGMANFRFYGINDWLLSNTSQTITMDISLSNNATEGDILMGPENFTLVDQWGWRYFADVTFSPVVVPPKSIMRTEITFSSMSPRSRPVLLEYDFDTDHLIQIPLDTSLVEIYVTEPQAIESTAAAPQLNESNVTSAAESKELPQQLPEIKEEEQKPVTTEEKVLAAREKLAGVQQMLRRR